MRGLILRRGLRVGGGGGGHGHTGGGYGVEEPAAAQSLFLVRQ